MWKHIAANTLTFLIIALIGLAVVVGWGQSQYRTAGPLASAICLKVDRGDSFRSVSEDLSSKGAISNEALFRVGAEYQERAHLLKAGSFLIEPGSSMEAIVAQITASGRSTCGNVVNLRIGIARIETELRSLNLDTGSLETTASYLPASQEAPAAYREALLDDDLTFRIIVAEGATSWQIVEGLKQADFLSADAGVVPEEGTLAPGSYEVSRDASRRDLLVQMAADQATILEAAWAARAEGLPLNCREEALILASIIEKETAVAEERRTIAQVFVNRLLQDIPLQTDPTVIYGITKGEGSLGRGLRQSELRRETPWNTYTFLGLPATAIANPGKAAIEAALNPDGSEFIFFVADGSGGHAFATTLAEHNRNVAKWRAIEAERSNN